MPTITQAFGPDGEMVWCERKKVPVGWSLSPQVVEEEPKEAYEEPEPTTADDVDPEWPTDTIEPPLVPLKAVKKKKKKGK